MKIMKSFLLTSSLLLAGAVANAAIIVSWDFDGTSPGLAGNIDDTTGSVLSVANATASGSVTATRVNGSTISNIGPSAGGGGVAPYDLGTAAGGIYNANGFGSSPDSSLYVAFQFTLGSTVDSSVSQLEGIQFDFANAGSSGPRGVEVTYRIGAGSFTSLGSTQVPNNTAGNYGRFTFNLSSPAALSANDVVEFRLLGFSNAGSNSIRFDNIAISAVPEPSAATLAVLIGTAALALGRRRSG